MLAGGTTESISHFAGFFRLIDDVVRLRDVPDGPAMPTLSRPWQPDPLRDAPPDRPLDELPSQPRRVGLPPSDDQPSHVKFHPPHDPHPGIPHPPPFHLAPSESPPPSLPDIGGGVGISTVSYDHHVVPDQELIQVEQVNMMVSNGTILIVPGTAEAAAALHTVDVPATLYAMASHAFAVVPADLQLQTLETQYLVSTIDAHDAAESASPGAETVHLPLGDYVDGVLQPSGTQPDFSVPKFPTDVAAPHNGLVDQGQTAETGSNLALNVATIFDDHTQRSALVVGGDAYSTDAIVQTNVLVSRAEIDVAGAAIARDLQTGGNTTHNSAEISQNATDSGQIQHLAFGTQLAVDQINGDFYDVKGVNQINGLSNNDTVVQGNFGGYYTAGTGANTQVNDLPINELNGYYDLIVVRGDFHTANLIYQNNLFLNDSVIKDWSARSDTTSQSIETGNNSLSNAAAIDHYGTSTFQQLDPHATGALDDLSHGILDPSLAEMLPATASGTLHVLYITGSFYNLNVIAQTNIVSNLDTVIQYGGDPGTTTAPTGQSTTFAQAADTGGNHLGNLAAITTVGTTSAAQYVGGTHYDQAFLIQANIVSDTSHVSVGGTPGLSDEIASFTGIAPAPTADGHHHAPMVTAESNHHEDLFHGMLS